MRRLRRPPRALLALLAVTAVALAVRLWALGWRVMHQDEARVADWILQYVEAGWWDYYPMIHGPFLPHVNGLVFQVLPPTDFSARLIVALIGGLLPLSAWLFREHLRRAEVLATGVFLAATPLLVYYSRFMRNDVPVAAFMLVAFGLFVRAYDTERTGYLYAGAFCFALAFTAKELALLYPFYWLGAAALLLDHRLSVAAVRGRSLRGALPPWLDRIVGGAFARFYRLRDRYVAAKGALLSDGPAGERLRGAVEALRHGAEPIVAAPRHFAVTAASAAALAAGALAGLSPAYNVVVAVVLVVAVVAFAYLSYGPQFVLAGVEVLAVLVLFYAPREPVPEGSGAHLGPDAGPGLFEALKDPTLFPAVVEEATYGAWLEFLDRWAASASGHSYVGYLDTFWRDVETGALVLFGLAVVGLLIDRYEGDGPRDVVALAGYWGFASFVTYPIIAENSFPWEMVHVVVPLAIPASVALGWIYRRGRRGVARDDAITATAAAILLLLLVGQMGATAYSTSFEHPQSVDNEIVQYAQPAGEMQPTLREIHRLSDANAGTDVLYYGSEFYRPPGERWDAWAPQAWFSRLPFPWYFSTYGADTNSTKRASVVLDDPPPVVIAMGRPGAGCWNQDDFPQNASDVRSELLARGYAEHEYQQYLYCRPVVIFVRS